MGFILNTICITYNYLTGSISYDGYLSSLLLNMTQLNILFIKLFQALSCNLYVSQSVLLLFRKNTNNAEYYESDIDDMLMNNIKDKYNIVFDSYKPINTGMIALVFKGKMNDKDVVIKIKRRDIRNKLERGYKQFVFWYNILRYLCYPFEISDFLESIASFIETKEYIMTQCNFKDEIAVMRKIKFDIDELVESETIDDFDKIVVPVVYNHHDDEDDFIIMDYLSGNTCFELNETEKQYYVCLLLKFAMCSSYMFEYTHTDLHPGNLICMNDNGVLKLGVIDYGMFLKINDCKVKSALSRISDLLINSRDKNKDFTFFVKDLLDPIPDITLYTTEQRVIVNSILESLFTDLLNGKLTELLIRKYKSRLDTIIPGLSKNKFDVDIVKLLMSFTMINSTILSMTNDQQFIYETQKKIIIEIYS
jgi:predicted unusual protein kinase regulating ubiquinone biosynthesis (AarF/ABC1/UbiB family)